MLQARDPFLRTGADFEDFALIAIASRDLTGLVDMPLELG
jgi:hypothetical protein